MSQNPTIIVAHLNDDEIRKSIDSLTAHVDKQFQSMVDSSSLAVQNIKENLNKLSSMRSGATTTSVSGSSQNITSIEKETQAREKLNLTYEQQTIAMQKLNQVQIRGGNNDAVRNADTLQTMNIHLDLLREKLREARQQYSSFVALAAQASTTGDKGFYQFATSNVHRYEAEAKDIINQIRAVQRSIKQMGDVIAPQGHTIQNYVNSLQKANPELAALNERFRTGWSLLANQGQSLRAATDATSKYATAEEKAAQAAKEHAERVKDLATAAQMYMKRNDTSVWDSGFRSTTGNAYIYAENDARAKGLTIEQQIENVLRENNRLYQESVASATKVTEQERQTNRVIEERKKYQKPNLAVNSQATFGSMVARSIGQDESQLVSYSSRISQLSKYIKQLETAYSNLTARERNSPFGKELRLEIQSTSSELRKFRAEMNRPISFSSINAGSAKTLDEIAEKMRQLAAYRGGLNVETQRQEIGQVNSEYDRLRRKMDEVMGKNEQMKNSNNALTRSWNYMKNRLAFYFTVTAFTSFIKKLVEVRAEYELNERALGVLVDSAEKGTQIFNELSQMSLISPYTLIELSTAAKQLTAYDVAARDAVDTTRRLADISAAVGIPVERLTYALGQVKAYGHLTSQDARQFLNAGVPIVQELAKNYTELEGRLVSTADVYDRMKQHAISYNDVVLALNKMTDEGGKFFDFQAKMAETLKVRLANLTLAWNNMLNDIGKQSQGFLSWGIDALKSLFLHWKEIDQLIMSTAKWAGLLTSFRLLGVLIRQTGADFGRLNNFFSLNATVGGKLGGVIRTLASSFKALALNPTTWIVVAVAAFTQMIDAVRNADSATKEFNKSLRDSAENNFKDITEYLSQYKDLRNSLYETKKVTVGQVVDPVTKQPIADYQQERNVPTDINSEEALKAWEAMRERIELSTAASDQYISRLLSIENISERLRVGFQIIDDIQQVNAGIKEMGDTSIKVTKEWSAWWNLWMANDGLVQNIKDVGEEYKNLERYLDVVNLKGEKSYHSIEEVIKKGNWTKDYEIALERLSKDVEKYTTSLDNFINNMGWASNPTQVSEAYRLATQKTISEGQLTPEEAYQFQKLTEEARGKAVKEALMSRIADEKAALQYAEDEKSRIELENSISRNEEQLKLYTTMTDTQRVEWERFSKYLKDNHLSEMQAMFRGMDAEQIKSINWQEEKYLDFVKRTAASYAKRHNRSYHDVFNELWRLIHQTNLMSIFIPLTISTEGANKKISDTLRQYDEQADAAYNNIKRIEKREAQLQKKGKKRTKEERQELEQIRKEREQEEKDLAAAKAKGGISKAEESERKKTESAARKSAKVRKRETKETESELSKALKEQLSLVEKVRSIYKELTKEGKAHADAVAIATSGWDETVASINKVLEKNGLKKLNLADFVGIENPRDLMNLFQSQLDALVKKGAKTTDIKELQTKIKDLRVDAEKYDLTKLTKGLNSELDKIKSEYELALELDAYPELGDMFADMMNIDTSKLPHTFGEALNRANKVIADKLKELGANVSDFDLMSTIIKPDESGNIFGLKAQSQPIQDLIKVQKAWQDMFKKNLIDSQKMLRDYVKKYGDYSDKIAEIEANRLAKLKQLNNTYYKDFMKDTPEYRAQLKAINEGAAREKSNVKFDAFKESRYYTLMFENLDLISTKTIRDMRDKIRELMDSMRELTPEQLKTIMQRYEELEQKLIKRNPFKSLVKNTKEYFKQIKDRKATTENLRIVQQEYDIQEEKVAKIKESYEQIKAQYPTSKGLLQIAINNLNIEQEKLNKLKEQLGIQEKQFDKYNLLKKVISQEASILMRTVASNLQSLGELRDFLQNDLGTEFSAELNGLVDGLTKVGEGLNKITSSAQSGDVVGAVVGVGQTIYGLYDGIASIFGGGSARENKITKEIQKSEQYVKRLELAYISLERAVNKAYGMATIGAQKTAIANKELQLAELKRQLQLEESRSSKKRDEDKILELRKQIKELQYDIQDMGEQIVNDLLGISSVGDAMESLMDGFIEALRNGEDAMAVFDESIDNMIANMVKKMFVTKILAPWFEQQWDIIQDGINKRAEGLESTALSPVEKLVFDTREDTLSYVEYTEALRDLIERVKNSNITQLKDFDGTYLTKDEWLKKYEQELAKREKKILETTTPTTDDIKEYATLLRGGRETIEGSMAEISSFLEELGLMNEAKDKGLSALQQGIQGVTEDTAGAVESYLNGMSQQAYYRNELLAQIKDAMYSLDMDAHLGIVSQILLQLQSSYQIHQSILSTMQGWNNASGNAVKVELIS